MIELVHDVGVTLVDAAASDDMVAMAAWVSNDADSESRLTERGRVKGLINFLYKNKHMSPFEHGHFTFKIDAPIFVVREFHRHRTASYNEVSGRYTEMKPRFYCADVARVQKGKMGNYYFEEGTSEQTAIYLQTKRASAEHEWEVYHARIEAGIAKEQAREELPLSLMTQFYVTMNPRNLMQFLTLRNDKHALKEIRDVAVKMEQIFAQEMPLTYMAYKTARDEDSVDVEDLKAQIAALKAENDVLSNRATQQKLAHDTKFRLMLEAQAERDEAYRLRDEAVEKYNLAFTTQKEAEKEDQIIVDHEREYADGGYIGEPVDINTIVEKGIDYIIPRVGQVVESAAPVYNVYVNAKSSLDSHDDITKAVYEAMKQLRKINKERGTR